MRGDVSHVSVEETLTDGKRNRDLESLSDGQKTSLSRAKKLKFAVRRERSSERTIRGLGKHGQKKLDSKEF